MALLNSKHILTSSTESLVEVILQHAYLQERRRFYDLEKEEPAQNKYHLQNKDRLCSFSHGYNKHGTTFGIDEAINMLGHRSMTSHLCSCSVSYVS